jgi:pheromone shutdown-related protein TraB
MTDTDFPSHNYSDDVAVIRRDGQTVLLVGTAHISRESADLVELVIEQEQPDTVCIELDEKRYEALSKPQQWEKLDLKQIIKNKQLSTLIVNLVLSSYQKKLGGKLGVQPGTELLTAAKTAERFSIPVELCDRDVRVTLRRAWKATSFWKKSYLVATLLATLWDDTELTEEKLAELRQKDVLSELMDEIGKALPAAKTALIDERDIFMAEKIKASAGKRVVAVVGAGHMAGLTRAMQEDNRSRMDEISSIPPVGMIWHVLGWSVPAAILLALVATGFRHGFDAAGANALYWVLATGVPAGVGAILSLSHPATILSAFVTAPLTTLIPVLGVGHVCAFVQVMVQPPVVKEFETVTADMGTFRGWFRNRLLRVFLAFSLPSIGASCGSLMGGWKIFSSLF